MFLLSNDLWNKLVHEKHRPKNTKLVFREHNYALIIQFLRRCRSTAKSGAANLSEDNNNLAVDVSLFLA